MEIYTIPDELRYTVSHLWVRDDDGVAVVGLTERGQEQYGKVFYVGLPSVGAPIVYGMPFGYLQSAGYGLTHLFPPVQGAVEAINGSLWQSPQMINQHPLDDGWIVRIEMSDPAELDELEDADGYRRLLRSGEPRRVTLPGHLLASTEPAFLIDERRRVLSCNPAAESLIGLSQRELRHGVLCSELFGCQTHTETGDVPITKSDCPGLCSMLNLEPVTDTEYTVTNAAGGQTRVRATYTPLAEPGQARRAVVVLNLLD